RLLDGPAFLVEDDRFRPYFFIHQESVSLLPRDSDIQVEEIPLCDLAGNPVSKVTVTQPRSVPVLREKLEERGAVCFEADIRFPYRYLIDHGLRTGVEILGGAKTLRSGLRVFENPELRAAECRPDLGILSLDIETSPDASEVFSIAIATRDSEEVHLISPAPVKGAIIHATERDLLAAFAARVRELDPDVLIGWNVVDFDLRVLEARADKLGLSPATRRLGRSEGSIRILQDRGFTRQSRAEIPGRMMLDGIPLVRDALRLEDYRLETVARAVLDRGKLIDSDVPDAAAEIQRLRAEDPEALVRYNLEDARLVLEILDHEGLLDLTLERSMLSGMQLDRVGASIASFDLLYLPALRKAGAVAPSVDRDRKSQRIRGGAVFDSEPGLFRNVALFDFKSLYPSLIRTFNLDPVAHARAAGNALAAPNGARFARTGGILPEIVEGLSAGRDAARERKDHHADQAIKIMMNAMFGVLGSASCRFFDPEVANAITSFGQQTLAWTRDTFEAAGVRVIYGDTDSVFVCLDTESVGSKAAKRAETLRAKVEKAITQRIRKEYGVESRLTLELERIYERFFLPRVRGGSSGSKKRYAGWIGGELDVVGLESVRRDWPAITRRLQKGMLERLFRDEDVLPFVREIIEELQSGNLDEELVYVKRVRKSSLDHYTASTPPHIQAARKAGGTLRGVIRYVITDTGPEPMLPGQPIPAGIDRRHYLEKVLRPVADAILPEIGHSFDEALGRPRQLSMF
ncbi:MAG: DNA polymerase II, partial [Myxococcota bacterium]